MRKRPPALRGSGWLAERCRAPTRRRRATSSHFDSATVAPSDDRGTNGLRSGSRLALIPLPALGVRRRRRRRRTVPGSPALSALLRLQEAVPGAPPDPATVRRAYATALADRLGLTSETFSRPGAVARALRRAGASPQLAVDSEEFMRQLDAGVFARHGRVPPDACDRAVTLYTQTDAETLPAAEIRAAGMRGMAAFAVFGAVAIAVVADSPASVFQRGIEAYRHHAYSAAEAAFGLAALAEIRSPDAWANYGTAAWASGDTAHAADGWQRAVRLDPLAPDLRHRIGLVVPRRAMRRSHPSSSGGRAVRARPAPVGVRMGDRRSASASARSRMWVAHDLLLVVAAVAAVLWGHTQRDPPDRTRARRRSFRNRGLDGSHPWRRGHGVGGDWRGGPCRWRTRGLVPTGVRRWPDRLDRDHRSAPARRGPPAPRLTRFSRAQ